MVTKTRYGKYQRLFPDGHCYHSFSSGSNFPGVATDMRRSKITPKWIDPVSSSVAAPASKPTVSEIYVADPKRSRFLPAAQLTKDKLKTLCSTTRDISSITMRRACNWLDSLGSVLSVHQMAWIEPLINFSTQGEIVFEWWFQQKKLTVYIEAEGAEYIKVWGGDIDNEMEDGAANHIPTIENLWCWLLSKA
jgi:hypothetical protein